MPAVFHKDGFKVFFYSNEGDPREPIHVHVKKAEATAKFWIEPAVAIAWSRGFNASTLAYLTELIGNRRAEIERAWNAYFRE